MPLLYRFVTQETFLRELASAEQFFDKPGKYVGLSHFVRGHLGPMGFDYRRSFIIAEKLHLIGVIEFYKVIRPDYKVELTAIRLQESSRVNAA
jgi:hypothetical protein